MSRCPRLSLLCGVAIALGALAAPPARAQCPAPAAPTITLYSNLPTAKGQTYVVAWAAPSGLQVGGTYRVERSADPVFAQGVETFSVTAPSASLKSDVLGVLYHRVRAVQPCGTVGPPSSSAPVTIVDGSPVVIFTVQPPAVVRTANEPASTSSFEVRNIGGKPFAGYLSPIGTPFFTLSEQGILQLEAGQAKSFVAEFYGSFSNTPGTYQGLLTIQSASGAQPKAYPWALLNLTVEPKGAARKVRLLAPGAPPVTDTEFASFKATAPGQDPPSVTIKVTNPRAEELALAAETGPDGWLVPQSGWNATPLKASETRDVKVEARRLQGETGGVYPRYAFLTLRTKDGQATRVQFQDLDSASGGPCATRAALGAAEPSYLVPSVATTDFVKDGRKVSFVSRLLLTNVGTDPVTTELFYTPDPGSPPVDGYDCAKVLRSTVSIPGSDVLSITDPLSKLFGFAPQDNVSGTLEIRSAAIDQVRADSIVDSPGTRGGSYGFQMPVARRGAGARTGQDHVLSGLLSDATYRTNVIFAETTGKPATIAFGVFAADGTPLLTAGRYVPAYAKVQVNDGELFGGRSVPAASLVTSVTSGEGSVVAVATIIDRFSQDASTVLSRPAPPSTAARRGLADGSAHRFYVPSVVNGYNSKPGSAAGPFPYESTLTITNGVLTPLTAVLTYGDPAGPRKSAPIVVQGRATVSFSNVLKEAFGIAENSTGPLLVEADLPPILASRVFSRTDEGVFGDAVPVYVADSELSAAAGNRRTLLADGLEHSTNLAYGARSNVILTEIAGKAAEVELRLFEKGKERSGAIGKKTYRLEPLQKLQVNDVFGDTGCGAKDRKNVMVEVAPLPGTEGSVVAIATRIDNVTADSKVLVLTPLGTTAFGGGIGIGR